MPLRRLAYACRYYAATPEPMLPRVDAADIYTRHASIILLLIRCYVDSPATMLPSLPHAAATLRSCRCYVYAYLPAILFIAADADAAATASPHAPDICLCARAWMPPR